MSVPLAKRLISKQLNASPYLCTCCPWAFPTTTGRNYTSHACWSTYNFTVALVSPSDQWSGSLLRKWDCMYTMHTRLENGVLCNRLQQGSAMNSFIDQGWFEAIKILSCRKALHNFVLSILEPSSSYCCWTKWSEQRIRKWHFSYCTLVHLAVFSEVFGVVIWVLLIIKALKDLFWVLK